MLLDRIDIDNHGPLNRVELGPFSEYLNVVCTPEGSGKTAIARFIRDSLIRREYPLGMMSSSAGRVVWADRNGKIHCRREHDGTASGRRTIEFESRGEAAHRFDWLHDSWISGIADSTDATRALESIRIPESIVDGIVTDTAVTSVSRVIQACLGSGLNDPALFAGLPLNRSGVSGLSPAESAGQDAARRSIRDELARVEAELASFDRAPAVGSNSAPSTASFDGGTNHFHNASIDARRHELRSRLSSLQSIAHRPPVDPATHHQEPVTAELSQLHDRIWQLRVRQSELSRWLSHLQSDRNRIRYTAPITAAPYAHGSNLDLPPGNVRSRSTPIQVDAELRRKLLDVDAQIIRWRRTMAELNSLREVIFAETNRRTMDHLAGYSGSLPLSEQVLRRERMNHFLRSLDHAPSHPSSVYPGAANWKPPAARSTPTHWPDELDIRIEAIVRQIDGLASHYDRAHTPTSRWYRDQPTGHAHQGDASLVSSLHAIREDLLNARRHGFRFGSLAAQPPRHAIAVRRDNELHDMRRSELWQSQQWIAAMIERLLAYREGLVRDRHLAEQVRYPSWLDESYHRQNWSAWYIDHLDGEAIERSKELDEVSAELDRCVASAAERRSQSRTSPSAYSSAAYNGAIDSVDVQLEIDSILEELRFIDQVPAVPQAESQRMAWLRNRRDQLTEKLGAPQTRHQSTIPLADEASQWLVRLTGGRQRRVDWNPADFTTSPKQVASATQNGFATLDGRDEANCPAVDRAFAALAIRLAAADLLARSGRAIPLVIEAHRELLSVTPSAEHSDETFQAAGFNNAGFNNAAVNADAGQLNLAVIAALDDFAKNGRQVILLASDGILADQVARRGGQVFEIRGERVTHEHRPLWRPHFANEAYIGPHAGAHVPATAVDPMPRTDAFVDRYYDQYFENTPLGASLADVNRNLDVIWQEAYGISPDAGAAYRATPYAANPYAATPLYEMPVQPPPVSTGPVSTGPVSTGPVSTGPVSTGPVSAQPAAVAASTWHDGYYFADSYTTAPTSHPNQAASTRSPSGDPAVASPAPSQGLANERRPASPFFLTVDSPIDQAPSVDAVAASRLRGLDVTHINHLMNQDPNRLADSLGLAGVTAATIRRWQSECRLVCHVPQLRGFDARVLVGCGIADAGHLAATDPNDLLDRVEAFLATERGQRILLSGTSYELSRITSWIASANVSTDDNPAGQMRDHQTVDGRVIRQVQDGQAFVPSHARERYEYEFVDDDGQIVRATSNRTRSRRRSGASRTAPGGRGNGSSSRAVGNGRGSGIENDNANDNGGGHRTGIRSGRAGVDGSADRSSRRNASRPLAPVRKRSASTEHATQEDDDRERSESARSTRTRSRRARRVSELDNSLRRDKRSNRDADRDSRSGESAARKLRFYLQRESPVVDAPSIGERMAAKLEAVGITTVDDLFNADPVELAEQLDHRRIDADVIISWQNQSILVCRIPMLRGHDAQLLVAAEITTPEEVAEYDPDDLFELIDPIARSNEGKRILRGGKLPDVQEISEWISYSALNRNLTAA